ncbi:hypothetical protein MRX96_028853 [Rhipicephalus microplus]
MISCREALTIEEASSSYLSSHNNPSKPAPAKKQATRKTTPKFPNAAAPSKQDSAKWDESSSSCSPDKSEPHKKTAGTPSSTAASEREGDQLLKMIAKSEASFVKKTMLKTLNQKTSITFVVR